jgi:MOSC domain-containing protein YiiM
MTGSIVELHTSRGGLPKYPLAEGRLTTLGIEGDSHNHPKFHGGPTRALLLICSEALEELKGLGFPVYPGAMGENVTTRGVDRRQMRTGQRYRLGECVIELTQVRVPCAALDIYGPEIKKAVYDKQVKAGDPTSPRWAMSGFYTSVVTTGTLKKDDIIQLIDQAV